MSDFDITEITDDLRASFGDPANTGAINARYMLRQIEENVVDGHVNLDYTEPSLDSACTTFVALYQYSALPWEQLAEKKPSIKRTLTYIFINIKDNKDKVESLLNKVANHLGDRSQIAFILSFRKMIMDIAGEIKPTKLIDYVTVPAHYDAISHGLHKHIRSGQDRDAAVCIIAAIEDGLLLPSAPRSLYIGEFGLNKSGFNKYFSKFLQENDPLPKNEINGFENKKENFKTSLRASIGYSRDDNGKLVFGTPGSARRSFIMAAIAYVRSFFVKS